MIVLTASPSCDGDIDEPDGENVLSLSPQVLDDKFKMPRGASMSSPSKNPDFLDNSMKRESVLPGERKKNGRQKKCPQSGSTVMKKTANGRSKAGCFTCRRRKKKCDETRPSCLNCQKISVICEGYLLPEVWRGGRQRGEGATVQPFFLTVPRGLPFLVDGIETDVDRRFLDHFVHDLSKLLTLHDGITNPFKDILLPMATQHKGLMHSLMCLSGLHLIQSDPKPSFDVRQEEHFSSAIMIWTADIACAMNIGAVPAQDGLLIEDPTVASTIVNCLISICKGSTNGEYRLYMDSARQLVSNRQSENPTFRNFLFEFFIYHEISNSLTALDRRPLLADEYNDQGLPNFLNDPTVQPSNGVVLGVLDGLFSRYITRITELRDLRRKRKKSGREPVVDYQMIEEALTIDASIRAWDPGQEPDTPRWIAAQFYRQCTWIYLWRTIHTSQPSSKITAVVDDGLEYLRAMAPGDSTQAVVLLPLFILGCAAFQQRQRPHIEAAFETLQEYSNFGNIKPARDVVRRVWEMMDAGDEKSWDWEVVMKDMNIDLLVT